MKSKRINKIKGFTLIEILIVIAIIAIIAAIVVIAINPAKQFAQARNTERTANVNAILNAIGQRMADNKGVFEGEFTVNSSNYICGILPTSATEISNTNASDATIETGELGCLAPTYIASLPVEPLGPTADQYTVEVSSNGRVTICAPEALNEVSIPDPESICVTR